METFSDLKNWLEEIRMPNGISGFVEGIIF